MSLKNSNSIKNLGPQLAHYFVERQEASEDGVDLLSCHSHKLANFLVGLRQGRGWTRWEAAERANLPETYLLYLEKGLILSSDIKASELIKLAEIYEQPISIFESLLERELTVPVNQLQQFLRWGTAYFFSKRKLWLTAVTMALSILLLLLNLVYILLPHAPTSTPFSWINRGFLPIVGGGWVMTAVTLLFITLWLFTIFREPLYQWFRLNRLRILSYIALFLLLFSLVAFPNLAVRQMHCYAAEGVTDCNNHLAILAFLLVFALVVVTLILLFLFNRYGRAMVRRSTPVRVQRKLLYVTVLTSLVMAIGMFIGSRAFVSEPLSTPINVLNEPLWSDQKVAFAPTLKETLLVHEMFWTAVSPQSDLFDAPFVLRPSTTPIFLNWHNERLPFAFSQIALTATLYTLLGYAVIQKGRRLSAFSRRE